MLYAMHILQGECDIRWTPGASFMPFFSVDLTQPGVLERLKTCFMPTYFMHARNS
jgi:hypothetical protein